MSIQYRNQTTGNLERVAGFTDVDSILSPSSKNPIANKAVYAALQQKIEKTVNDLVEYYTKSDVYNKAEVRQLIGAINTLTIAVVSTLPTSDISTTTIYFVGPATGTNTYDEYVYVNNTWVKIGDTDVDLTDYITSSQLTTVLQDYYTKNAVDALLDSYYTKINVDNLLDDKQDTLTFDNTPTAGSDNPVTSGGVKSAIDAIPSNPVDVIANGNMRAVTSNAVYDHLFTLFQPIEDTVVTNTDIDLNNCTTGGFANFLVSPTNPHSCGSYGYLLVLRYGNTSSPNVCQVHFPYHSTDQFAIRCRFSDSWTNWKLYGAV